MVNENTRKQSKAIQLINTWVTRTLAGSDQTYCSSYMMMTGEVKARETTPKQWRGREQMQVSTTRESHMPKKYENRESHVLPQDKTTRTTLACQLACNQRPVSGGLAVHTLNSNFTERNLHQFQYKNLKNDGVPART